MWKYEQEFRIDKPETIGETDKSFDLDNYKDWLEEQLTEYRKQSPILAKKITKIKYPVGGFAPGYYMTKCVSCKHDFMGDKYARQCEPCAINAVNESNIKTLAELYELKAALEKIKFSNDTINHVLSKE